MKHFSYIHTESPLLQFGLAVFSFPPCNPWLLGSLPVGTRECCWHPEAVSFQGSKMHKPSTLSLTHRVNVPALARLFGFTEVTPVLQYLPFIQGPKLHAVFRYDIISTDQSRITLCSGLCFYSESLGCCWRSLLLGCTAGQCPPCAPQHAQIL